MNKQEWIKGFTTGRYSNANKDVIAFIANFVYHDEAAAESIYQLFASGYCYYFATILKTAFNRGTVCWHRNYDHIVWVDDDGIAYDIGGVFNDYEDGELLLVESSLGNMIVDFKHNGKTWHSINRQFHDWAKHYGMTDIYAVSDIYRNMPKDEIDDRWLVESNVIDYWNKYKRELSDYYSEKKQLRNVIKRKED